MTRRCVSRSLIYNSQFAIFKEAGLPQWDDNENENVVYSSM